MGSRDLGRMASWAALASVGTLTLALILAVFGALGTVVAAAIPAGIWGYLLPRPWSGAWRTPFMRC